MSAGKSALKLAGVTVGVAAGMVGGAYAAQRALVHNLRHRPDPDAGRLGPLVFDEERRLPANDGGNLYVASRGSGPPIVLAHGLALTSRTWVKQFQTLPEAGVRAIALDHRGHGLSTTGSTGHSIENLAWDVRTVLEGLDLTDVVLVGHSMGGVAAQAFASRFPEVARARVRGLVLLSSFARTVRGPRPVRAVTGQLSEHISIGDVMARPDLGTMLTRIGFGRTPLASQVELTREMLVECDPATSREAVAVLLACDLTADLANIELPTLVIGGTADVLTPPSESRRIAELIPGARLVMVEGAGHMVMLERADEFDALVLDFAREVGALPSAEAASA